LITLTQAKANAGKRVTYSGNGRPWLKNVPVTLTGATSNISDSAQVSFTRDGSFDQAWVGINYLTLVDTTMTAAIDALKAKRDELKSELEKINTAIKTLESL
jgi:hypothetical protein